jgi:hypothetical protein
MKKKTKPKDKSKLVIGTIGPYKEAVLYEIHNGAKVEIRRMRFRLTETEASLLREKKKLENEILRAKTALNSFSTLLQNTGMRVADGMTEGEIKYAIKVLKEFNK